MKETLHIENFGPITKADLILNKVNLFIGPQGAGKSTVAKLYTLLNTSLEFTQYNLDLYYSKNSIIKLESDTRSVRANHISASAESSHFHKEINIQYIPAERLFIPTILESSMELLGSNISLPKTLTQFGSYFQKFRKQENNFKIDILDIDYSYSGGKDTLQLHDNTTISLSNAATGMQALIPMYIVINELSKQDNSIFIIEEPELNLYPSTQKLLVEFLIEKCTSNNNRLFITTHSPYILSSLNNLIQADNARLNNPAKENEISAVVKKEKSISFDDVSAYYLPIGKEVESIKNEDTRLLNAEAIDDVSDIITDEFDRLTDLKYDE